jgi:hypothetical protein
MGLNMAELDDIRRSVEQMPIEEISPIVRSAVGDDSAVVKKGWAVKTFSVESIGMGTLGFLKPEGRASVSDGVVNWSLVVKVMDVEADAQFEGIKGSFTSQHREIGAYASGFFDRMDGGLRAAPCHGITRSGDVTMLWMEDLSESAPVPWGRDEFLTSAHNIGFFNGSWPENRAPAGEWLNRAFIANRLVFALRNGWFDPISDPKTYQLSPNWARGQEFRASTECPPNTPMWSSRSLIFPESSLTMTSILETRFSEQREWSL